MQSSSDYVIDFTVRAARLDDVERMAVLWQETAEVLSKSDPRYRLLPNAIERWQIAAAAWLADAGAAVIVAERKGVVVGYIIGTVIDNTTGFAPAQIGSVIELTIDTHGRGDGGIGTHLLLALRGWLNERGVTYLIADTPTSHAISQAFWRASGATPLHHRMWLKVE